MLSSIAPEDREDFEAREGRETRQLAKKRNNLWESKLCLIGCCIVFLQCGIYDEFLLLIFYNIFPKLHISVK